MIPTDVVIATPIGEPMAIMETPPMQDIESQRVVNPSMIIVNSRNIIGTTVEDNHLSMTEAATTSVAVVNAVESSQGEQQQQTLPPPPPPQRRQQEATNDADSDEKMQRAPLPLVWWNCGPC
jgi:hypothetical protein